jgi:hypothetical protein
MDEILDNRPPEIPCHEVLYRAVLNKRHISADGQVAADVFFLRAADEGMLSVFRKELVSMAVVNTIFAQPKRFVTLHTGRVRDAGTVLNRSIDVVPDEHPTVPGHAVVTGLPDLAHERAAAEFAASILRDQCRLIAEDEPPAGG